MFYIWQDEIEDLQSYISMAHNMIERERSLGHDVSNLIEDIKQWKREIVVIQEHNKPIFF